MCVTDSRKNVDTPFRTWDFVRLVFFFFLFVSRMINPKKGGDFFTFFIFFDGKVQKLSPGCDHPGGVVPFFIFSKKKKSSPPGRSNRPLVVQTVPLTLDFEIWRTLWPLVARQKHSRAMRMHTGSNLCRCFWNPWSFTLVQSSWVKMGRWEEFIGNPKPIWARRTKRKKKQGKS